MGISFIITAGGVGKRMGSERPKQFLTIGSLPILMHTIARLHAFDSNAQLIVTLPGAFISEWQQLCNHHSFAIQHTIVAGGIERYHSIKNALKMCTGQFIAVHDGVRPFVTDELLSRLFQAVSTHKAVIPVMPVNESLRHVADNGTNIAVERAAYRVVQTPQVFEADLLRLAYETPYNRSFTDDASLVELLGQSIHLVAGTAENIKITQQMDLVVASKLLS